MLSVLIGGSKFLKKHSTLPLKVCLLLIHTIHFKPITIRILKKDLFHTICSHIHFVRSTGPIGISDFHFIKHSNKGVKVGGRKGQMNRFVQCDVFLNDRDKMQFFSLPDRKPSHTLEL